MTEPAITVVRAEYVRLLQPFVSTEETRYYLGGVNVEPHADGGAVLVATDGHRLGAFRDTAAFCEKQIILRVPKTAKPLLNDKQARFIRVTGDTAEVLAHPDDTAEVSVCRVIGTFPEAVIDYDHYPAWRRVVPRPPVLRPRQKAPALPPFFGVNASYLSDFAKISPKWRDTPALSIGLRDAEQAMLVHVAGRPEFIGVLMPMRTDEPQVPAWAAYHADQEEEAA